VLEVGEGSKAGAEIVQADTAAGRLQGVDEALGVGEIGHGGGFRDLDQQTRRVDLLTAQQVGDIAGQTWIIEGTAGDVDGDGRPGRVGGEQVHGLAEHPAVDFQNLAAFFRHRDEQAGGDQFAAVFVTQANQGFQMGKPAVAHAIDTLEMQFEQVVGECPCQTFVPGQTVDHFRRGVEVGAIQTPGVLASLLGLVHGGIGAGHQLVLVGRMQRVEGNPQAGGNVQGLPFEAKGNRGDGAHDAFGQGLRLPIFRVGQEHGEFVAAEAEQHLVLAGEAGDFSGYADQHGVAGGVAEVVVDRLELVEVEIKQRGRAAVAHGFGQRALQFDLETVPVEQAGERVAFRQVEQLFRGLAFARDILVDPEMADETAVALEYRVTHLGGDLAILQHDIQGCDLFAPGQDGLDVFGEMAGLQQLAGAVGEHLARQPAHQVLLFRDQPEAVERGVVVDHAAIRADEQDAQVHRGKQGLQARMLGFRLGQIGLRALFRFPQRRDAAMQLPRHFPEGTGQAAHFVARGGGQAGREIALGQCPAGLGEQRQPAGQQIADRQGEKGRQHRRQAGIDALTQHPCTRFGEEAGVDAEMQAPVFGAGETNGNRRVVHRVVAAQSAVRHRQRLPGGQSGAGQAVSARSQQDEVAIGVVAARFAEDFMQGAIVALHQGRRQGGIEQGYGAIHPQPGLADEFLLSQMHVAEYQDTQDQRLDQQTRECEFEPEGGI